MVLVLVGTFKYDSSLRSILPTTNVISEKFGMVLRSCLLIANIWQLFSIPGVDVLSKNIPGDVLSKNMRQLPKQKIAA